jgi:hypothetical protein
MSLTLDQKIFNLEAEIAGYREKLDDPSKLAPFETYESIEKRFNTRSETLNKLLDQMTATLRAPSRHHKQV